MKRSFIKTHNVPNETCLCGNAECTGLTAAFRVLRDARKRCITIPPYQPDGDNQLRESYLRHLLPRFSIEQETPTNYIALHHFHPCIVDKFHHKIPKTLSLGQAVQLRMMFDIKDKVTDEYGMPAMLYCPNYSRESVKQDLMALAKNGTTSKKATQTEASSLSSVSSSVPAYVALDDDEQSDVSSIYHEEDEDKENDRIALEAFLLKREITCHFLSDGF